MSGRVHQAKDTLRAGMTAAAAAPLGRALLAASLVGVLSSCGDEPRPTEPVGSAPPVAAPAVEPNARVVLTDHVPDSVKAPSRAGAPAAPSASVADASALTGVRSARTLSTVMANVVTTSGATAASASFVSATSIAYAPEDGLAANFGPACDDCVMTDVPIGFSFTFFGNTYDRLDIASNGFVRFGVAPNRSQSGCCSGGTIPLAERNSTDNLIAVAWTDWMPAQSGMIRYETRGDAPNRRFLIQYINVPDCCNFSSTMRLNAQLILYEGTNVAEVHVATLNNWGRQVTQGIENETGTVAAFMPGRVAAAFSLTNDAVRFTTERANNLPVASAGGSVGGQPADHYEGAEGSAIEFTAAASDPDGDALSYAWDFDGDGNADATSPAASHVYADNGDFTATLTVNDGRGGTAVATVPVHVTNSAPVVSAGADVTARAGAEVALDAAFADAGANDHDWTYTVLWGDDAGGVSSSTGTLITQAHVTASHAYAAPGVYTVVVRVRDKDGAEGSDTLTVTATNRDPAAVPSADHYEGSEGQSVDFDASASSDADGDALSFAWDFGDGSAPASGAKVSHVYADNGSFVATLTVSDGHGGTSRSTVPVEVRNLNPTASLVPPSGSLSEGSPFALAVAGATDVAADAGSLRYAFDCGTGYGPSMTTPSVACTLGDNGGYTVRGKVEDKDGGVAEYSASVKVANVAPTATFTAPASVPVGTPIVLGVSGASDPSAADLATLSLTFDCGTGAGFTPSAVCPTTAVGTRSVYGRVTDKDGGANTYGPFTVTVTPAAVAVGVNNASAQYSDPVSLSATVASGAGAEAGSPTGTMEFFVNGASVGTAQVLGTGTVTLAPIAGTRAAGSYPVTAVFRPAAGGNFVAGDATGGSLTVVKENVKTEYTGDVYVVTAGPSVMSASVRLGAALTEDADGNPGNVTLARARFELYRGTTPDGSPDQVVDDVAVDASGNAVSTVTLAADSWTVRVLVPASNSFWTANPIGVGTFTIVVAAGGNERQVTGAGWLSDNAGSKFSFNVNNSGNSRTPKGSAQYVFHAEDGYDYAVNITAWDADGLTFYADPTAASFSGRCSVQKIEPATGRVLSTVTNYTLTVDVFDGDAATPRTDDRVALTILDASNTVWRHVGTRAAPVPLGGGNINVRR